MSEKQSFDNKSNAPKTTGAEQSATKRFFAKKWVFPVIYVAAAAIILTLTTWLYQSAATKNITNPTAQTEQTSVDANGATVPVAGPQENMKWPVKDKNEIEVVLKFYDRNATAEAKAQSTIEYNDTFVPNTGLVLARKDKVTFDVLAAKSGKVSMVATDPAVGNLVEITHADGMVTVYQSLADVKVAKGQDVKQGDVIAKAGRNDIEKAQDVHLHFEVRQQASGTVMNPEPMFTQSEEKK
ncbi:M23 family metallopeptidase [Paenibacillus sp. N1-5-1-14]|uniref:M23 family metallopeptidase n=1 Tax=Paenibacillus radicibacter TaxID=2972488 RepID=UPI002159106D|nr:M23 family metallopeptidase [Paenibacillus radicibacter]MCR8645073.1 M23 family metallopeptidase [Paenibacillus radicibacter]